MPTFNLNLKGLDRLKDRVAELAPKIRKEVSGELYRFAEEVLADSQEVVPVDVGNLMNSGHVEMHPDVTSGGSPAFSFEPKQEPRSEHEVVATVGYGGAAREYALYVHEELQGAVAPNPNWSWAKKAARGGAIDWSRPGSGPKYLERPLRAKQGQLPGRLAAAVKRGLA